VDTQAINRSGDGDGYGYGYGDVYNNIFNLISNTLKVLLAQLRGCSLIDVPEPLEYLLPMRHLGK
jgi:hypothetical protein